MRQMHESAACPLSTCYRFLEYHLSYYIVRLANFGHIISYYARRTYFFLMIVFSPWRPPANQVVCRGLWATVKRHPDLNGQEASRCNKSKKEQRKTLTGLFGYVRLACSSRHLYRGACCCLRRPFTILENWITTNTQTGPKWYPFGGNHRANFCNRKWALIYKLALYVSNRLTTV